MKLRTLLVIFCLIPVLAYSRDDNNEDSSARMIEVTRRYLDFINRISQGEVFPQYEEGAFLLAADCQKVFNGKLFTSSREDFIADLLEVNRNQGCWSVVPVEVMSAPQSRCTILRLMIEMDNFGTFTAILILRFNSDDLISEINEVFNRAEGSYHFEDGNSS